MRTSKRHLYSYIYVEVIWLLMGTRYIWLAIFSHTHIWDTKLLKTSVDLSSSVWWWTQNYIYTHIATNMYIENLFEFWVRARYCFVRSGFSATSILHSACNPCAKGGHPISLKIQFITIYSNTQNFYFYTLYLNWLNWTKRTQTICTWWRLSGVEIWFSFIFSSMQMK